MKIARSTKVRLNIRLYRDTKEQLVATAVRLGISETDVMELALRQYTNPSNQATAINMADLKPDMGPLEAKEIGYAEAAKVDGMINNLIAKYPVEKHFFLWKTFTRTVRTSVDLIDDLITANIRKDKNK